MVLVRVTKIPISVTTILTISTTVSVIKFVPFALFSICITSEIQEALKMYSFWQKVNRLPLRTALKL